MSPPECSPGGAALRWCRALTSVALRRGAGGSMRAMHAVEVIFAIGWAAFWTYWLLAAFSNKR